MNRTSSNWTGRIPRTAQQAFGPYTDHRIADTRRKPTGALPWLVWAFIVVVLMLVVAL